MTDTIRTKDELKAIFADNFTGDITPQDIRDFVVSNRVVDIQESYSPGDVIGSETDIFIARPGASTCNLPAASQYGNRPLDISNVSGGVLTVTPNVGDNISGEANLVLQDKQSALLLGAEFGFGWLVIVNTEDVAEHTHTKSDITDFNEGDYANATHTHTKADITDFSDGDYAAASHTHVEADITDLDKYTQTEVDNAIAAVPVFSGDYSDLTNVPTEFTPSAHTHVEADITDLDKYTVAQVDTALSGKANTSHTHVEADITDLDKYTVSEVDTALSGKADTSHAHVKADITDFSDGDYATSAQGSTADTATQPGDNVSTLVNDAGYLTEVIVGAGWQMERDTSARSTASTSKVVAQSMLTPSLPAGTYKISINVIAHTLSTGKTVGVSVEVNGTTDLCNGEELGHEMKDTGSEQRMSHHMDDFYIHSGGTIDIDVHYRLTKGNGTIYMDYTSIEIYRVA